MNRIPTEGLKPDWTHSTGRVSKSLNEQNPDRGIETTQLGGRENMPMRLE